MQFLMNFFGNQKDIHKTKKIKSKKHVQFLILDHPQPHQSFVGKDTKTTQQKILKQDQSKEPKFYLTHEAQLLQTRILQINQLRSSGQSSDIDYGLLVGLVNSTKRCQELIGDCVSVNIGTSKELNSLKAIRNYSLDCLVVFWNNLTCQFTLTQLVCARQRLVFVVEEWSTVKQFILSYETSLQQIFGEKTLSQCSDKMIFNLIHIKNRFIIDFQDQQTFTKRFTARMKNKFPSLTALEQLEQMIAMLTLNEYLECFESQEQNKHAKTKIEMLRNDIQNLNEEQKKQEALKKIQKILAAEEEEVEMKPIEPVRKNSSKEAEIQAEYFGKRNNLRESQKETRESGGSRLIDNQQLYYFIEEHDQSSNEEFSCTNNQQTKATNRPSNTPPRIIRSKSWNQLKEAKPEQLDDEFFQKY